MNFKNMKIPVENNLDEIVATLESKGYQEVYKGDGDTVCILTDTSGGYSLLNNSNENNPYTTTLSELKGM